MVPLQILRAFRLLAILWMAVDCGAETTTKGHGRSDFAGQRRRSLDLLPQVNVADGTPLKRQFQHQYDSGHRLITEWVATDTTAGTAFTLGTDFNAAPSSANLATVAYAMNLVGNRDSRTKAVSGTDPLGAAVAVSVGTYAYDNQVWMKCQSDRRDPPSDATTIFPNGACAISCPLVSHSVGKVSSWWESLYRLQRQNLC